MSQFPWRTLLFLSAALNLLLIGGAVGAWSAGVRVQREASPQTLVERLPGPRAFIEALPPETRASVGEDFAESWTQSRELRRAAADARREAFATAAAEPYDPVRVRAAFERARAADQAALGVFHDNVSNAFARLTPAQRRAAMIALRRARPAMRAPRPPPAESEDTNGEAASPTNAGQAPEAGPAPPPRLDRETIRERRQARRERMRQRMNDAN